MKVLVIVVLALLLGIGSVARADEPGNENLQAMRGIRILVEDMPKDAAEEHITRDMLATQIAGTLRSKAPRLQIQPGSAHRFPTLYTLLELVVSATIYAGHLSLEVSRPAELLIGYDNDACNQTFFIGLPADQTAPETCRRVFSPVTVWTDQYTLVGPRGGAAAHVERLLGQLLEHFLAGYDRANP